MKTYTLDEIRRLGPCYDPAQLVPEDWTGTLLDVLDFQECPAEDRVWACLSLLPQRQAVTAAVMLIRRTPLCDGRTVGDLLEGQSDANQILALLDGAVVQDFSEYLTRTEDWRLLSGKLDLATFCTQGEAIWPSQAAYFAVRAVADLYNSLYDASTDVAAAVGSYTGDDYSDVSWDVCRSEQVKLLRAFVENSQEEEDA